jgi:hypothetical protein
VDATYVIDTEQSCRPGARLGVKSLERRQRAGRERLEMLALCRKGNVEVKKPSSSEAMASQPVEPPLPEPKGKAGDGRINTTLRISPEGLEALKNIAAAKRIRVNDLLLEGAEYVLALNGRKMRLRR